MSYLKNKVKILFDNNNKRIDEMRKELEKLQYHSDHITCPECDLCGTCVLVIKPLESKYRAFIEINQEIEKLMLEKDFDEMTIGKINEIEDFLKSYKSISIDIRDIDNKLNEIKNQLK